MPVFCTPQDLRELADLLLKGKVGEVEVTVHNYQPEATDNPVIAETRKKFGFMPLFRTQRGGWGPEFTARVLNPLTLILNKFETFRSNSYKSFMDSLEPIGVKNWFQRLIGIKAKDDQEIFKRLLKMDDQGRYVGPDTESRTGIDEAARRIWKVMDNISKMDGVNIRLTKYLEYRAAIAANGNKGPLLYDNNPFYQAFRGTLTKDEVDFFYELERRGIARKWGAEASSMFQDYVNSVGSKRILTPAINKLQKDEVAPFFGAKYYSTPEGRVGRWADEGASWKMWEDLKNHIYGQPTPLDKKLTYALQQLADRMGVVRGKLGIPEQLDTSDTYSMAAALSSLFYAGVLSTPGAIIRQTFQLVPSLAYLGVRPVASGLNKVFDKAYVDSLIARGIIQPPLEAIHEQVGLARNAGRYIHKTTETFLKLFDASDRMMRVITAAGADFHFEEAATKGIESIRAGKEVRDQIIKLYRQNKIQEAKDLYMMDTVANTQFVYGRVNRPEIMRGALGQAVGMLQSYPMNLFEMYTMFGKRFVRGAKGALKMEGGDRPDEMMPLIRQLGLTAGIIMAGKEAFGTDLASSFIAFPGSPPTVEMARSTLTAGRTNFEWLYGKAFSLGETDYHKRLRTEADNELMRQAPNFIPGGLFAKQMWKVADEPTFSHVMKVLGFPPLAEDVNMEVRAKAAQKRQEKKYQEMVNPSQ